MVSLVNVPYYLVRCDLCLKTDFVEKGGKIYNGAQAVRSLSWSFGKKGHVLCCSCRRTNLNDRYKK